MERKIGLQLYSLRTFSEKDFPSVLKFAAETGFKTVEPAGFFGISPRDFRAMLNDLGLEMPSSHTPWVHPGKISEAIDLAGEQGLDKVVCGFGPGEFKDLDAIKKTADTVNEMCEIFNRNGFTLFQHNHYWEFERIDGRLKYDIYRELCPNVKYQMDCFWSTNKGQEDPVAMLKDFAKDTILMHMKDGQCRQQAGGGGMVNGLLDMKIDLMPLGTGTLPIADLMAAAPEQVEAVIVELDYCTEEMVGAVEKSYRFMTENGLAAGNK